MANEDSDSVSAASFRKYQEGEQQNNEGDKEEIKEDPRKRTYSQLQQALAPRINSEAYKRQKTVDAQPKTALATQMWQNELWKAIDFGDDMLTLIKDRLITWERNYPAELVNLLIEKKFETNEMKVEKYTLLHFCVLRSGRTNILNFLANLFQNFVRNNFLTPVQLQRFVNEQDFYNNTALMEAAKRNNINAAIILTEKLKADKDKTNSMRHTALTIAGMNGHINMVKYLIEKGANVLVENVEDQNVLQKAVLMQKLETIRFLEPIVHEAKQWRAKNCLVKLMLNRRKAKKINNVSVGIFREIIKYAGV